MLEINMSQTLPIPIDIPNGQGLAAYIQAVNAAPILTADQERELAVRYGRDNDLDAARQVFSHSRADWPVSGQYDDQRRVSLRAGRVGGNSSHGNGKASEHQQNDPGEG